MLAIIPASVCYFACISWVREIKFFQNFESNLVFRNLQ